MITYRAKRCRPCFIAHFDNEWVKMSEAHGRAIAAVAPYREARKYGRPVIDDKMKAAWKREVAAGSTQTAVARKYGVSNATVSSYLRTGTTGRGRITSDEKRRDVNP